MMAMGEDEMEDEFLWWQRRGLIALALGVFIYGMVEKPILLLMAPLLLFVIVFAVGRILRDNKG